MNKIYFCFLLSVLVCLHNYATGMIVLFMFQLVFVPSKAYRIFVGDFCLILLKKTETLCSRKQLLKITRTWLNANFFCRRLIYKLSRSSYFSEFLELQTYSPKLDYYRLFCFDRFCFLCVVCLFWWLYGFLWWVFAIEKLEYSRYNAKTKYELVWYITYSSDLFFLH